MRRTNSDGRAACKLQGHEFNLQELNRQFTSLERSIVKDEDGYFLRAVEFATLTNAGDVLAKAKELLPIIGSAKVLLSGYEPVAVDKVLLISDGGERQYFVFAYGNTKSRSHASATATVVGGAPVPQPPPPKDVEFASAVAQSEERVRRALAFLDHEHSCVNLDKEFELVRADVGVDMVTKGWTTKAEAGRFTQTTNSVGASGDEARHAAEHTPPPKPMSLKDAEQFIKALLADLIRSKK